MARQYLDLAQVYGAVDQSRANKAAMENNRLQNERYQRQIAREDADLARQEGIRGIYKGAIEIDEDGIPKLNERKLITDILPIAPEEGMKLQEGFTKRDAEAAKAKRENQKFEIENKTATVTYLKNKLATVQDDAGYQAFKQEAMELGAQDLVSSAPPQFDPAWQQGQMVNADKFLERNTPKYERVDLGGKIQVVDVNPVTNPKFAEMNLDKVATISEKESMRHNRVQESNSAATLAETKRKNSLEGGAGGQGKAPSGFRWKADGTLEAIPGGPGEKSSAATEGERKAATLLKRLEFSQAQLSNALKEDPSAASPELDAEIARGIPIVGGDTLANLSQSGTRQQVEAAQLDILDAALTLGTGAAYTKEQLQGYRKSYFPQIGDSNKTIADKQARLNNVIEAAKVGAGRAATPTKLPAPTQKPILPKNTPMPAKPKLGTVEGGYVYAGGNPSDPKSWKKK